VAGATAWTRVASPDDAGEPWSTHAHGGSGAATHCASMRVGPRITMSHATAPSGTSVATADPHVAPMKRSRVPSRDHGTDSTRDNLVSTLLVIGLVLPAPACLVGPDFATPKVALNASWAEHRDPRIAVNTATEIAWWKTFADPTLDEVIELAYHQNLPLQVAGLRILEARAQLGIAVGQQYPTNPGPVARAAVVKPSEHAFGSFINHHYGEYQIGFDAIWELDFWGKFRRGVRAANASYLATVADYDGALVSLSAEAARTYVAIRTFEVLIDLARENVRVQEEGQQIAEARFRNGATSQLDVAQATNLLESTRATIPVLEIGQRQAQNALSTLLGRPTGYVSSLLGTPRGIPAPPARVAVSVPAEMLRRRPDIRGAELRAAAQCERIGIAKAQLYPSLVLFGSIGTQTTSGVGTPIFDIPTASFTNLFGPGSLAYNAGGSLFWPILSYRQLLNGVRVEDARFEASLVDYVNTVLRAAQEVEDGMIGFLRQQDAAAFEQNAVTAAEIAVRLALVQYREGAVDYQRVLDSQRALLTSQNRLASTRSEAVTELIALYKALGGGWELRQGDPVVPEPVQREMQDRTHWNGYFSEPPGPDKHTTGDFGGPGPTRK
jgi:NodT family efflux transporter outer membrane factor (OMF) lipoprotein